MAVRCGEMIERSIQEIEEEEGRGGSNCQLQLLDFIQLICCWDVMVGIQPHQHLFCVIFYWGPNMYQFLPEDY